MAYSELLIVHNAADAYANLDDRVTLSGGNRAECVPPAQLDWLRRGGARPPA
jgi:hypothetical protein